MQKHFFSISQSPLKNSKKSPEPDTCGASITTQQKGELKPARKLSNPDNLFSTPRNTRDEFEQNPFFDSIFQPYQFNTSQKNSCPIPRQALENSNKLKQRSEQKLGSKNVPAFVWVYFSKRSSLDLGSKERSKSCSGFTYPKHSVFSRNRYHGIP